MGEALTQFTRLAVPEKDGIADTQWSRPLIAHRRLRLAHTFERIEMDARGKIRLRQAIRCGRARSDVASTEAGEAMRRWASHNLNREARRREVAKLTVVVEERR